MRKLIYISLVLLLTSCISKTELKPLFPFIDFNANSAKVWVIHQSSNKNDPNVTALDKYKTCFIFYSNNTFKKQELIHLGSDEGDFGKYQIIQEGEGEFSLKILSKVDRVASYKITYLDSENLTLKNKETNVIWEFRTLTPPL